MSCFLKQITFQVLFFRLSNELDDLETLTRKNNLHLAEFIYDTMTVPLRLIMATTPECLCLVRTLRDIYFIATTG